MGYKPDVVQKPKSEYSPLGQVFNKGLDSNEKQEGLLKRLKNIDDKTDNQLDLIKDEGNKRLDLIDKINRNEIKPIEFYEGSIKELSELSRRVKEEDEENIHKDFYYKITSGDTYNFNKYLGLGYFGRDLFSGIISLGKAKNEQDGLLKSINKLEKMLDPSRAGPKL